MYTISEETTETTRVEKRVQTNNQNSKTEIETEKENKTKGRYFQQVFDSITNIVRKGGQREISIDTI